MQWNSALQVKITRAKCKQFQMTKSPNGFHACMHIAKNDSPVPHASARNFSVHAFSLSSADASTTFVETL